MSELRISASSLRDVSAHFTAAVSSVPFDASLSASREDVLGTPLVASPLRDGSMQQSARATFVSDALHTVAKFPANAVASFSEADAALARAF
jgi:hypothetical protein